MLSTLLRMSLLRASLKIMRSLAFRLTVQPVLSVFPMLFLSSEVAIEPQKMFKPSKQIQLLTLMSLALVRKSKNLNPSLMLKLKSLRLSSNQKKLTMLKFKMTPQERQIWPNTNSNLLPWKVSLVNKNQIQMLEEPSLPISKKHHLPAKKLKLLSEDSKSSTPKELKSSRTSFKTVQLKLIDLIISNLDYSNTFP